MLWDCLDLLVEPEVQCPQQPSALSSRLVMEKLVDDEAESNHEDCILPGEDFQGVVIASCEAVLR